MAEQGHRVSVLAIFCNPKGTDSLRLQSEQRILQRALRSTSATLEVVPAATLDDLRLALCGRRFDVIHFSGHGCVDGPLGSLVRHNLSRLATAADVRLLTPLAVAALKGWLATAAGSPSADADDRTLCTLALRPTVEDGRAPAAWVEDADCEADDDKVLRVQLSSTCFTKFRVGALAFEGPTGALEPPKPDVLSRMLLGGLEPNGVIFLNACDTHIQARWLREHGAGTVVHSADRISDVAASEFSRGFYEAIAMGCATLEAYAQGRLAVELRYDISVHGCPCLQQSNHGGEGGGSESGAPAAGDADGGDAGAHNSSVIMNPLLEEFIGESVGTDPPLQELAPMPGSHQLAVCETLPRYVRDEVGRLHSLSSISVRLPRLEDAIDTRHLPALPTVDAFRHAHRLLGQAQKLRWGVLQQLDEGQLLHARATLLHALALIRAVGETVSKSRDDGDAPPHLQSGPAWVYPELSHQIYEADTTLSLAVVMLHLRDASRASEHAAHALDLYKSVQASTHAAFAQLTLSECAVLRGDQALAEEHLRGALRSFRSLSCALGEAEALRMLGALRLAEGDEISGRPLLRDALTRYDDAHSPFGLSTALGLLGPTAASTGADADVDADFTSLLEQSGLGASQKTLPLKTRIGRALRSTTTAPKKLKPRPPEGRRRSNRCLLKCSCFSINFVLAAGGDDDATELDAADGGDEDL